MIFLIVHHGRVPAAGLMSWIGVPVVPCGRRVVISGILAGGTPGFCNALMVVCTLPGRLAIVMFLVSVSVSMYARLNH